MSSARGVARALRSAGVFDGMWTGIVTIGSKAQTLVVLAVAGRIGGQSGVGQVAIGLASGLLLSSVADLGMASQVARGFSAGELHHRRELARPLATRLMVFSLLAAAYMTFVGIGLGDWAGAVAFGPAAIYGASALCSLVFSQAAYGCGRFRAAGLLNGGIRLVSILALVGSGALGWPAWSLLLALAGAEVAISVLQYRGLPRTEDPGVTGVLRVGATWRFGLGSIVNTLINKADVVLISLFCVPSDIGVYAMASQIQNALTTVALVPSGGALARVASASREQSSQRIAATTAVAVAATYLGGAGALYLLWDLAVPAVFGFTVPFWGAVSILVTAGLFSCVAAVGMQGLTGEGRGGEVAKVWLTLAPVALAAMSAGAYFGASVGAAFGALARDLTFVSLAWAWVIGRARGGPE